jgi:hypothetical protein
MDTKKEQKGRYFQMPSALLVVLSDTALRILAYAIDKQGLVNLGYVEKWSLTPTDVSMMFGKFKGYSFNVVQKGFRELKELRLITYHQNNHYTLNTAELETWYKKGDTQNLGTPEDTQNLGTLPPSKGGDTQNLGKGDTQNLGTNKRDYKREEEVKEENRVKEVPLNNSGSLRETVETSSASVQEPKALPDSDYFNELFPDSPSPTSTSSNAACGTELPWDELESVIAASGVSTLGSNQSASYTPSSSKAGYSSNPFKIQEVFYASGSAAFSISPTASVCTRHVGNLPKGMGTHYGASRA